MYQATYGVLLYTSDVSGTFDDQRTIELSFIIIFKSGTVNALYS